MDPLEILARSELFAGSSADEFTPLARSAVTRRYRRGEVVWATGDKADRFYLILSGEVTASRIGPDGEEYVVEVHVAGDVVGALHLFEPDGTRLMYARAGDETSCWIASRDDFLHLLDRNPSLMKRMLRTYSRWIIQRDLQDVDASFRNLRAKVATKLLHLADRFGEPSTDCPHVKLRVTETKLASMIGASRENVSRSVTQLQRAGELRRERGYLLLIEPDALRRRYSWVTDDEARTVIARRPQPQPGRTLRLDRKTLSGS